MKHHSRLRQGWVRVPTALFVVLLTAGSTSAQSEDEYYKMITLPIPHDLKLEVSGLALLPDPDRSVRERARLVGSVQGGAKSRFRVAGGFHPKGGMK